MYVSARNLGFEPGAYLDALPAGAVGELHLAGHATNLAGGRPLLIDDQGSAVPDDVWALYARAVARFGPAPAWSSGTRTCRTSPRSPGRRRRRI